VILYNKWGRKGFDWIKKLRRARQRAAWLCKNAGIDKCQWWHFFWFRLSGIITGKPFLANQNGIMSFLFL